VDEMQNMTWEELDTVITRVGDKSKLIMCGDFRQTDLKKKDDKSGLLKFLDVARLMKEFVRIEFNIEDIVRSSLVRSYIIAKTKYEDGVYE
jgi:phosphate starvation-inducible protein PhoH